MLLSNNYTVRAGVGGFLQPNLQFHQLTEMPPPIFLQNMCGAKLVYSGCSLQSIVFFFSFFCQRIINLCGNQELHFWGQGYPWVVIQIYATQMKLLCYWRVEIWESGFGMYKWKRCFSRKYMWGYICILIPRQKYFVFLWMDISVKIQLEFQFPTDQNNNEVHCPTSRGERDFLQQTWWAHWKWDCQCG